LSEGNILTPSNLPFIDLGDKPSTFGPNRSESDQMFICPKTNIKEGYLVLKYSYCKGSYMQNKKKLKKKFKKMNYNERGL
jgi:hypothetical protein